VTEEITFDGEPNLPPVILTRPGEPTIGSIVWVDSSTQSQWTLLVQVRDENVEQTLEARWRIRQQRDMQPPFVSRLIPGGSEPVRDLDIFVDTGGLTPYRCHRFELVVSGSFIPELTEPQFFDVVLPANRSDIASASWWIWAGQGRDTPDMNKLEIFDSCEVEDAQPVETVVEGGAQ
jgi:hypothetical protein